MNRKSLSALGFIMDSLNIQTVTLARALHVDASLVSKWRTGDRHLTFHSVYFEDAINYIFEESSRTEHTYLKDALLDLYPHEILNTDKQIKLLLGKAITNSKPYTTNSQQQIFMTGAKVASTLIFEGNSGRVDAIRRLLDYAGSMEVPGEIIFIDSEEFSWLIDNESFAAEFTQKIILLLQKGFHSKFVIHYSSYKENFLKFFTACSALIFHRNVDWYYCEYYDETIFNFSLFILNHSISMLGIAEDKSNSTTMVFSDTAIAMHHENLAKNVIARCRHLFNYFEPNQISAVTDNVFGYNKNGAFYSYLPAPAFFCTNSELLKDVLIDNNTDEATIKSCLELNAKLSKTTECYFSRAYKDKEPFIHLFQLEELISRVECKTFISSSLTIVGGKNIKIRPEFYARELRYLAAGLEKHENLQVVLVSKNDNIAIPYINCWCRRNSWMIQMDDKGFRSSEEVSIVNAAAVTLERCIRKVPPERKNKDSVKNILLRLADTIDKNN